MKGLAMLFALIPYICLAVAAIVLEGTERTLILLISLAVHELGHIVLLNLFGEQPRLSLVGMAFGLSFRGNMPYLQELCVVLSGVGANAALGISAWFIGKAVSSEFLLELCEVSMMYACVNALPLPSLDGERALTCSLTLVMGDRAGRAVSRTASFFTLFFTLFFALYMLNRTGVGIYLLFFSAISALKEQKQVK